MMPSPHVTVSVDADRLRANAVAVRETAGVPVLAVVKADAYGLGVGTVIPVIDDVVDGYCFFSFGEILAANLRDLTRKPAITLGPPGGIDPETFLQFEVRPAVANVRDAAMLKSADPILAIDTGQQRFACPPDQIDEALRQGACREAMTHASRLEQVEWLLKHVGGRGLKLHAAGSSLLPEPSARLNAVRPGLAIYRGAVRVTTKLFEVRDSAGPAGYSGFFVPRHGVILCGYSHGLRRGPCLVNGTESRILEVGMQSAFVECSQSDRAGGEVTLLGDSITEQKVAAEWGTASHVPLVVLTQAAQRAS